MYFFKQIFRQMREFLRYMVVVSLQRFGHVVRAEGSFEQNLKVYTGIHKILVVRLDEIGDMVLMSPFLRELRQNYPTSHITLVVKSEVYNLVERCPYVNQVRSFSRVRGRGAFYRNLWRAMVFSHKYFREENYDLAFVPRFDADYAYGAGILAFFSKAKARVGYSEQVLSHKVISDRGYDGFYTDVLLPKTVVVSHEVERNLDMLRFVGGSISDTELELWTQEEDVARVENMLWDSACGDVKRVAVILSAGRKNKEWDLNFYIDVIQKVANEINIQVILLGAGDDAEERGEIFCSHISYAINLINKTTLRESAEALRKCDCYLGGDTGLLHMAAVLKMKGIAFFVNRIEWRDDGIDTPERFGPWNSEISVLQPNAPLPGCEHGCTMSEAHCIREIRVEEVKKQLLLILADEDHRLS